MTHEEVIQRLEYALAEVKDKKIEGVAFFIAVDLDENTRQIASALDMSSHDLMEAHKAITSILAEDIAKRNPAIQPVLDMLQDMTGDRSQNMKIKPMPTVSNFEIKAQEARQKGMTLEEFEASLLAGE
ncbi:hypothetical protein [Dyadobacter sp. CY312]|uniref:hypothetical protein n=1 Tax=Dyadobacter sp. CY312 TaxID=2907303 RepID=UPI001F18F9C4|nr:hypothetical protein [Dyadobacter sp. CY312]MCE7039281.1 hypothetical protein [Dyadobacter sp. CY312]